MTQNAAKINYTNFRVTSVRVDELKRRLLKGLVSCRVMHCGLLLLFTFYSNTTNSDKNTLCVTFLIKIRQKRARIIKGWFKYMTDCKHFPDHLIYSSRKMATSRSLSPRIPGVTLIL
jgi:hypothetical protein